MTSKGPVDKRVCEQSRWWGRKRSRTLGRLPALGCRPAPLLSPLAPLAPGRPAQSLLPVTHTPMPHRPGPWSGLSPDLLLASRHLSEQTPLT